MVKNGKLLLEKAGEYGGIAKRKIIKDYEEAAEFTGKATKAGKGVARSLGYFKTEAEKEKAMQLETIKLEHESAFLKKQVALEELRERKRRLQARARPKSKSRGRQSLFGMVTGKELFPQGGEQAYSGFGLSTPSYLKPAKAKRKKKKKGKKRKQKRKTGRTITIQL